MKKKIKRLFGYSMGMGGASLIAGKLPSPAKIPIQVVATRGTEFVVPMVSVTGASIALKNLGKFKLKERRRRYK